MTPQRLKEASTLAQNTLIYSRFVKLPPTVEEVRSQIEDLRDSNEQLAKEILRLVAEIKESQ